MPILVSKMWQLVYRIVAVLALLAFGGSWAVRGWMEQRSHTVQRITLHDAVTADLLGEKGTAVGEPVRFVFLDAAAPIQREADGSKWINDAYFSTHYPLQFKTVLFVQGIVAWVSGVVFMIMLLLILFTNKKIPATVPEKSAS